MTFTNAPNLLTLLRIALVPIVVGMLFIGTPIWDQLAAAIFILASITDYFDGYLARRNQQVTIYGKLMDPLADKFLVVSCLVMLQHLGKIHPVVVMLLICRELAITGLRALASAEGVVIAASDSAKLKTATQMTAIPILMVSSPLAEAPGPLGPWSLWLFRIGTALIYVSLAISLWSAKSYVVGFFIGVRERGRVRAEQRKAARDARKTARIEARESRKAARLERWLKKK